MQSRVWGDHRSAGVTARSLRGAVVVLAIALSACGGDQRVLPKLSSPQQFAKRIQDSNFGCRNLIVWPHASTDRETLIAHSNCDLQQRAAMPTKKEIQKLVDDAKRGRATTETVSGPVGLFIYRDKIAAAQAIADYVTGKCTPPLHPREVVYYAGANFMALSPDDSLEVLGALDTIFGAGTVHEPC